MTKSVPPFVTHFGDRPKIFTYRQISPNTFFAYKLSCENKNQSSTRSNYFVFKETLAYKCGVRRSV